MEIKNFLTYLYDDKNPPSKRGYYFERYIILMLNEYLENNNIFLEESMGNSIDAMIVKGFDNIEGPVAVEIKISKSRLSATKMIESSIEGFIKYYSKNRINIKTILFIIGISISEEEKEAMLEEVRKKFNDLKYKIEIWTIEDLENKFSRLSDKSGEIIESLDFYSLNSNNKFKKETTKIKNIQSHKKNHISNLKSIYKEEGLTLFLGAGVSIDSGLPPWNELIGKLSIKVLKELMTFNNYLEEDAFAQELSEQLSSNPLTAANYLEMGTQRKMSTIGSHVEEKLMKKQFYSNIKESLYSSVDKQSLENNQLLSNIAKGVVKSFDSNIKGIQKIVTYNYDDLLEQEIAKISRDFKYQIISQDIPLDSPTLPIYHVHGFLPYDLEKYNDYSIEDQEIIFTEEAYHNLQLSPYSWNNLIQINSLRDSTVLMVGLSVDDPNLRRLLNLIKNKSETKHYVLLKEYKPENLNRIDSLITKEFTKQHTSILESTFEKLGVNVTWFREYGELQRIVNDIIS